MTFERRSTPSGTDILPPDHWLRRLRRWFQRCGTCRLSVSPLATSCRYCHEPRRRVSTATAVILILPPLWPAAWWLLGGRLGTRR